MCRQGPKESWLLRDFRSDSNSLEAQLAEGVGEALLLQEEDYVRSPALSSDFSDGCASDRDSGDDETGAADLQLPDGFVAVQNIKSTMLHLCREGGTALKCGPWVSSNFERLDKPTTVWVRCSKCFILSKVCPDRLPCFHMCQQSLTSFRSPTFLNNMASAPDSQPFFEQHATKIGMEQALLDKFIAGRIRTVSQAAYAATPPGQVLTDERVTALCNTLGEARPSLAQLTIVKRLLFESQTISLALESQY